MTDLLFGPIDSVSIRWLVQVAVLSLGLTAAISWAFARDSLSRRSLGVAAVWLLGLVPVVLLIWAPRYQIGLLNPPELPALSGVPAILVVAWLMAAAWGVTSTCVAVIRTTRAVGRLPEFVSAPVKQMSAAFCARLGMTSPTVVIGERCCASSIANRRLVVPADFGQWPVTAQRSVIAHELVHLKRGDDRFMVALQLLVRCYLFCPWLHGLYQRFVHALEEACDERAAELVGCRSGYLEGLAEAALREGGTGYGRPKRERARVVDEMAPTAALINAEHKNSFLQRVARLLGKQQFFEVQSGALVAGTAIGLFVLTAFTTFEFVEVPRRYQASVMNVASAAIPLNPSFVKRSASLAAGRIHDVSVKSYLPNQLAMREERLAPIVIYPGRALIDGIEGEVLVEFGIAADGSTVQPRVVRSTQPNYFNRAALRAVRQTVYDSSYQKNEYSGVTTAQDLARTGELLAVRTKRSKKAQKLFLFRLNASN